MRMIAAAVLFVLACSAPARADPMEQWNQSRQDGDIDWLEESDWKPFASNYTMDIGVIAQAKYYVAWRDHGDTGVLLKYDYATPVSPAELPGPGPMSMEIVEVTVNCASATSRIHRMYLYAPDGHEIGMWYDPAIAANPSGYGSSSIIGKAASRVC